MVTVENVDAASPGLIETVYRYGYRLARGSCRSAKE